ncbi:hypothetical protein ACIQ6Y_19315 [Streptomyces sp. NPDC096205]|uniref:hypothetical protein n=1 Tax=Streptomyces sp. NPDC096205 TaxID=3366081 RepID=UPI003810303F
MSTDIPGQSALPPGNNLQADGEELLRAPYADRPARLERLSTEHDLAAPWTLCPQTTGIATAQK